MKVLSAISHCGNQIKSSYMNGLSSPSPVWIWSVWRKYQPHLPPPRYWYHRQKCQPQFWLPGWLQPETAPLQRPAAKIKHLLYPIVVPVVCNTGAAFLSCCWGISIWPHSHLVPAFLYICVLPSFSIAWVESILKPCISLLSTPIEWSLEISYPFPSCLLFHVCQAMPFTSPLAALARVGLHWL